MKETGTSGQWDRFCRLGEMMGDGLHHESDGKWISREYKKLMVALVPEVKEAMALKRKSKAAKTAENMAKLLTQKKCNCGGDLYQKRQGTKVCYCNKCNSRYIAIRGKK